MNNKVKIRNTLKTISAGFLIAFYVSSCTENDNIDETKPISASEDIGAGLKSSKISEADLLKAGWTVVKDIKSSFSANNEDAYSKNATTSEEQKFKLTAQHLSQLGYDVNNPKAILEKFIFRDIRPDGVNFNSELKVGDVSNQETGDAHVLLGKPSIEVVSEDFQMPDEAYVTDIINNGDKEVPLTKKYTYKQGYKTTWQRKVSGSLKVGAKLSIGIPTGFYKGEVSTEVTVGGETTDGTETSTEKTIEDAITVPVPAHSKVKVAIITKITKSTVKYSVPMSIMGSAWTNYYTRVDNHYFWGLPASGVDNSGFSNYGLTHGNLTSEAGEAASVASVETKIIISKPESL